MIELNIVSIFLFALPAAIGLALTALSGSVIWLAIGLLGGAIAALSPRVAQHWNAPSYYGLGGSPASAAPVSSG